MRAQIFGIVHEPRHHQEGERSDRDVDVEIPAPVPVVGDPSAQRRTHDRRDHQPDPPHRHRKLLLVGRKGLHQDRLRRRNHRGAGRALDQPEQDHLIERLRRAAHRGGDHEYGDRGQEIALAAEARRDPPGHRNHDPIGDQVAGQYPRDFIDAGGEGALHMRQRDVDDRGIEHFERGAEHHRDRDQPFVRRGSGARRDLLLLCLPHPIDCQKSNRTILAKRVRRGIGARSCNPTVTSLRE